MSADSHYVCWQSLCLLTVTMSVDSHYVCWQSLCLLTVTTSADSHYVCWQSLRLLTVTTSVDSHYVCWQSLCLLTVTFNFILHEHIYNYSHRTVNTYYMFNIHGSVHRRWLSRNTNKKQLCNRIYYSKVYWRLNMFQEAHRSSRALNCICGLWFIFPCGDRPFPLNLGNGRSPHGYINKRLQIQFRAPDDEWCAARNMLSLQ